MQLEKLLKYSAIALIFALCLSNVGCSAEESQVIDLEEATFDDAIAKHQFLLLEFYAPWCGHCKALEPEYKKAAQILKEENSNVRLAKIDATENVDLASRFEVRGYPTIKFYKNGEYIEYNGGRTAEEIVQWVTKKSGPPSVQLNSVEEVENFKTKSEFVIVYFGSENSENFKSFNSLAEKYDYFFGHSFNDAVNAHYNVKDNLVLFKNFDELRNDFTGELTQSSFEEFSNVYSLPIVGKFNDRLIEVIFDKNGAGFFYFRSDNSENDVAFDEVIRKLATTYRKKLVFVSSDIVGDLEERVAEYYGIDEKSLPKIIITKVVDEENVKNYNFDKEFTQANVEQFIEDFLANKLKSTLKSEPVPESQDEAVYKVVGTTFNDVVINNDKHVLVEFYAPWCGHCKNFAPIYEEIAQAFNAENSNVVIAKMDATENEVEGLQVSGFPTIKFYKAGDKTNPIDYEEGRAKWEVYDWFHGQINPNYVKPTRTPSVEETTQENQKEDL
jgi:protein disulfide-isomerase A1